MQQASAIMTSSRARRLLDSDLAGKVHYGPVAIGFMLAVTGTL